MEQFIDFVNIFSLETIHTGVYVTVENRRIGMSTVVTEAYGILIHKDLYYYYVVTDINVLGELQLRRTISIMDAYEDTYMGEIAARNDEAGIVLIRFPKVYDTLEIAKSAVATPLPGEPVILLSQLNDIRSQITFGKLSYQESTFDFETDISLNSTIIGGGVFDVNHQLVGLIVTSDGTSIVMYDVVYDLVNEVLR